MNWMADLMLGKQLICLLQDKLFFLDTLDAVITDYLLIFLRVVIYLW